MGSTVSRLTVPGDLEYLAPLLAYAVELARQSGFDDEQCGKIRLALEEAASNVMQHAFAGGEPGRSFDLICERSPLALKFVIREKGIPFDPARFDAYSPAAAADGDLPRGLGLQLMRRTMDSVEFHNLGREGKETVLVKYLKTGALPERSAAPPVAAEQAEPRAAVELIVRDFKPEDALGISRAAYRVYDYSYDDFIYHPEQIAERNRLGLLRSIVAVTAQGEVCGHCALEFTAAGAPTAETAVGLVTPEYRSHNIGRKMTLHMLQRARELGLRGLYARAVSSHTASQKGLVERHGFIDCAILVAAFPDNTDYRQMGPTPEQKESAILMFLPLAERSPCAVYPPPRHRERIEWLYRELGLAVELREAPAPDATPRSGIETRMKISSDRVLDAADIELTECGDDAAEQIRRALRELCLERIGAIFAYLDLESPLTPELAAQCERLGFFFSGIQPYRGAAGRDALILQYLNNVRIDYDKILVHSARGRELCDYVRGCDPSPSG